MRRRNRGVEWVFITGLIFGAILFDGGDDQQKIDNNPQSQTLIDFDQGDAPVITKVETFQANQWRQVDSDFFICPGKYKDWSIFKDSEKCRVRDDGFIGLVGGTVPGQEQPIRQALEQKEGRSIGVKSAEVNDEALVVKYQYVPAQQSTDEAEQAIGTTKEFQVSAPASVQMTEVLISIMDSMLFKILAGLFLIFGLIRAIWGDSVVDVVISVVSAIMPIIAPELIETSMRVDEASIWMAVWQTVKLVFGGSNDSSVLLWTFIALGISLIALSMYRVSGKKKEKPCAGRADEGL